MTDNATANNAVVSSNLNVASRVDAQGNQIREAAKWLVGSFAAVGAALIAGSQLSSIGKLPVCAPSSIDCARLWVAGGGAVIALIGVMWAVWTGVGLLAPERLQTSGLKAKWKSGEPIYEYFRKNTGQLQGFKDLEDMEAVEAAAAKKYDDLFAKADEVEGADRDRIVDELQEAADELSVVFRRVDDVVTIANHVQYVHFFRKTALKRLIWGAGAAAVGIVAFTWAANPPTSLPRVALRGVNLTGANLTGANFTGVDLTDATLTGANLTGADLRGADLTDADLSDVMWDNTTCPDGTNSDNVGGSCENHL